MSSIGSTLVLLCHLGTMEYHMKEHFECMALLGSMHNRWNMVLNLVHILFFNFLLSFTGLLISIVFITKYGFSLECDKGNVFLF
jgi:hypothetical protein